MSKLPGLEEDTPERQRYVSDKIPGFDPAAAPAETDGEAAGAPYSPAEREARSELRQPPVRPPSGRAARSRAGETRAARTPWRIITLAVAVCVGAVAAAVATMP